jgi:hypothetical protein
VIDWRYFFEGGHRTSCNDLVALRLHVQGKDRKDVEHRRFSTTGTIYMIWQDYEVINKIGTTL